MLGASMEAKVALRAALLRDPEAPFAWVATASVYGVGELEMALRRVGRRCLPGVNAIHRFHSWSRKLSVFRTVAATAGSLDTSARQRLPAGGDTGSTDSTRAGKLQGSPRQDKPKLAESAA